MFLLKNMQTSKPRVIKDYDKLSEEIKQLIKLKYPEGYSEYLIKFTDTQGHFITGLPFETSDRFYMVRMTHSEAQILIDEDEDFDEDGVLTDEAVQRFEDTDD